MGPYRVGSSVGWSLSAGPTTPIGTNHPYAYELRFRSILDKFLPSFFFFLNVLKNFDRKTSYKLCLTPYELVQMLQGTNACYFFAITTCFYSQLPLGSRYVISFRGNKGKGSFCPPPPPPSLRRGDVVLLSSRSMFDRPLVAAGMHCDISFERRTGVKDSEGGMGWVERSSSTTPGQWEVRYILNNRLETVSSDRITERPISRNMKKRVPSAVDALPPHPR